MNIEKAAEILKTSGEPAYRLEQIRKAVFRDAVSSYAEISTLPQALRERLEREAPLLSFSLKSLQSDPEGRAFKALLELADGKSIETVLLKPSPRRLTCCISSQVGCAVRCSFCATGLMGFTRHLTSEEISDQVLFWMQFIAKEQQEEVKSEKLKVKSKAEKDAAGSLSFHFSPFTSHPSLSNVVYMGMGEPFHNYEAVSESLRALTDPRRFNLASRRVSVSTSGVVPKIEQFGRDFPQINLALSLHAAHDPLRSRLVPLNKAYPLNSLSQALKAYIAATNRKVFLEYVMLAGENDSPEDADKLGEFLAGSGPKPLLHVNLIAYNPSETSHRASPEARIRAFQARLRARGIPVTVRNNLGRGISGACGQLAVMERASHP